MQIDRAGYPFIAGALVPALGLALSRRRGWAVPFALAGGFLAYFFRDPDRHVPSEPGIVVSPADGKVMVAGAADPRWAPPGTGSPLPLPVDAQIALAGGGRLPASIVPTVSPACRGERQRAQRDRTESEADVRLQAGGRPGTAIVCRVRRRVLPRGGWIGPEVRSDGRLLPPTWRSSAVGLASRRWRIHSRRDKSRAHRRAPRAQPCLTCGPAPT